jgi:hypothetical protein
MSVFQNFLFQSRVNQTLVLGKVVYYAPDGLTYYFVTSEKVGVSEQNGHLFPVRHYSVRRVKGNSVTFAEGTTKGQFSQRLDAHAYAATLGQREDRKPKNAAPVAPVQTEFKPLAPKPAPEPVVAVTKQAPLTRAQRVNRVFKIQDAIDKLKAQIREMEAEMIVQSVSEAPKQAEMKWA